MMTHAAASDTMRRFMMPRADGMAAGVAWVALLCFAACFGLAGCIGGSSDDTAEAPEAHDPSSHAAVSLPAPGQPAPEPTTALGDAPQAPCTQTCAELRSPCGRMLTACGTLLKCDDCPDGEVCGGGGANRCGTNECTPLTCADAGATCGMISDGCGDVLDCGGCPDGEACVGQSCTCTPTTCAEAGATCGSISDGCGNTLDCGSCDPGLSCQNHVCACAPTTCAAAGASCGSISDGCGNTLDCGGCPNGKSCNNNVCCASTDECGNGVDDDCDGSVDEGCTVDCTTTEGNNCNGDSGYGDHCDPSENTNGCSAERFWAWCNRRNDAYPNIWDDYLKSWVDARCDGAVSLIDPEHDGYPTFTCTDSNGEVWNCTTPLVLAFDRDADVTFVDGPVSFSLDPATAQSPLAWPAASTPWLALDRNRNGRIDDGGELFGSATPVSQARGARHGFEPLAELDSNHDGLIDAQDRGWSDLLVWRDADANGQSDPSELMSASEAGLLALSLDIWSEPRCDARARCERERAEFQWIRDGQVHTGVIIDVYLPTR